MTPLQILRHHWGYEEFRPQQAEIIESVIQGHDTFVIMPTGGGKSLCYQVPALTMQGVCIVISPLIALMEDQVQNLQKKGIPAILINSTLGKREINIELQNARNGKYKFLYLAPERLKNKIFQEYLKTIPVSFLAVDEAHCISQWGYDFRPAYLEIVGIKEVIPDLTILALTASATVQTANDVMEKLGMAKPRIFQTSVRRSNLRYRVVNMEDKRNYIVRMLGKIPGSALVYVNSRAICNELASWLENENISVSYYHAGLSHEERTKRQLSWVNGSTRVMVCTNAFGMGVDKPDVRLVMHYQPPSSMEAYYQEAGRAGRDGEEAECVLLFTDFDVTRDLQHFHDQYPHITYLNKLYEMLGNYFTLALHAGEGMSFPFDMADFCKKFGFKPLEVHYGIKLLELTGYLTASEGVHTPSRIKINLSSQDIYAFQVKHEGYEPVIKTLLRSYGGILDRYVAIHETELSDRIKQKRSKVIQDLDRLHAAKVLDYVHHSDLPQITYLLPRAHKVVDQNSIIETLKKRARKRMEVIHEYLESEDCRENFIAHYFGEKINQRCGICDVCTTRNRLSMPIAEVQRIEESIKKLLNKSTQNYMDVIQGVHADEEDVRFIVRCLIDDQIIRFNPNRELEWGRD